MTVSNVKRVVVVGAAFGAICGNALAFLGVDVGGLAAAEDGGRVYLLKDGNVLMTDPDPLKARLSPCQPVKGSPVVAVREVDMPGFPGQKVAYVQVADGNCLGKDGWVGLERLEAIPRKATQ